MVSGAGLRTLQVFARPMWHVSSIAVNLADAALRLPTTAAYYADAYGLLVPSVACSVAYLLTLDCYAK